MQEPVNARSLADLANGAAEAIINAAIKQAVMDMDDRAHEDGKPRMVMIQLTFQKDEDQVFVYVDAQAKMPPRRTPRTIAEVHVLDNGPTLQFQTMDAGNPRQRTIDERLDDGRSA